MGDWSGPGDLAVQSHAFVNLLFALFGIYVWELLATCSFEHSLITGKRRFRWPLIFFFLCRYCILFALIGLIISVSVMTKVNCGALYTFNSWNGNTTILAASTSLMLRTVALWERRWSITLTLGFLSVVHWGLLYRCMFVVKAAWDDTAGRCIVVYTNLLLLNTSFFYTMGFDLVILIFTAVVLGINLKKNGLSGLLFRDGLVYFLVTFTLNTLPAVLNILDLSVEMNVIATIPAVVFSAIAACRAVIRLQEYSTARTTFTQPTNITNIEWNREQNSKRSEVHLNAEGIVLSELSSASTDLGHPTFDKSHTKKYYAHAREGVDIDPLTGRFGKVIPSPRSISLSAENAV